MKTLAIIGSGDLGKLIAYHATNDKHYQKIVFFDDFAKPNSVIENIPVLGKTENLIDHFKKGSFDEVMIGIGYKHMSVRKKLFNDLNKYIPFGKILHSSSYVDASDQIGAGCFILPGCTLDKHVVLKENVLLNTGCVISHDSVIGANSFLSPAVSIAGFVSIGENCVIGINSIVIDNISICEETQTGGGTVVIKNITQKGLYVGNPARFIR